MQVIHFIDLWPSEKVSEEQLPGIGSAVVMSLLNSYGVVGHQDRCRFSRLFDICKHTLWPPGCIIPENVARNLVITTDVIKPSET
jgi:hypothetical protein